MVGPRTPSSPISFMISLWKVSFLLPNSTRGISFSCVRRHVSVNGGHVAPPPPPEPVVIEVLWGKVATKVGTFLAKSINLVPTFPMARKLLSYRQSTYLVATFKKSSNLVPTMNVGTLVPTLYVL